MNNISSIQNHLETDSLFEKSLDVTKNEALIKADGSSTVTNVVLPIILGIGAALATAGSVIAFTASLPVWGAVLAGTAVVLAVLGIVVICGGFSSKNTQNNDQDHAGGQINIRRQPNKNPKVGLLIRNQVPDGKKINISTNFNPKTTNVFQIKKNNNRPVVTNLKNQLNVNSSFKTKNIKPGFTSNQKVFGKPVVTNLKNQLNVNSSFKTKNIKLGFTSNHKVSGKPVVTNLKNQLNVNSSFKTKNIKPGFTANQKVSGKPVVTNLSSVTRKPFTFPEHPKKTALNMFIFDEARQKIVEKKI